MRVHLRGEVACDAEAIAAGCWWEARGDLAPDRQVLLIQELHRWCPVISRHHALRWDRLERAGNPEQAAYAIAQRSHQVMSAKLTGRRAEAPD